jgi:hypothetical protein
MVANPIRHERDVRRFLALDITAPTTVRLRIPERPGSWLRTLGARVRGPHSRAPRGASAPRCRDQRSPPSRTVRALVWAGSLRSRARKARSKRMRTTPCSRRHRSRCRPDKSPPRLLHDSRTPKSAGERENDGSGRFDRHRDARRARSGRFNRHREAVRVRSGRFNRHREAWRARSGRFNRHREAWRARSGRFNRHREAVRVRSRRFNRHRESGRVRS